MSKIKNGELDQYGAEPYEQQKFGTAGVEGVNDKTNERTRELNNSKFLVDFVNPGFPGVLDTVCNYLVNVDTCH